MMQTDHKPLKTILHRPITAAPLRLQVMILKLRGCDLKVGYLPDKKQVLTDTLRRASLNKGPLEKDEIHVNIPERTSISEPRYAELQQNTASTLHEL